MKRKINLPINRYDTAILVVSLLLAVLLQAALYMNTRAETESGGVRVTVNGEETAMLPLNNACVYEIKGAGGLNTLEISAGQARITFTDCPDALCVKSSAIPAGGRTIVCLPHRVVVEVIGAGNNAPIDAVTR